MKPGDEELVACWVAIKALLDAAEAGAYDGLPTKGELTSRAKWFRKALEKTAEAIGARPPAEADGEPSFPLLVPGPDRGVPLVSDREMAEWRREGPLEDDPRPFPHHQR